LTDGFHLVVDALKANDIDTSYGVVGIPITDLARVAQASGIRYIGFRQETSAGNAAAAAGFLTRRPGVCLTVSARPVSSTVWPRWRTPQRIAFR
jgi:oxalyl-CoA decarboxylase